MGSEFRTMDAFSSFRRFFPTLRGTSIGEVLQSEAGNQWIQDMSRLIAPKEEEEENVIPGLNPNQRVNFYCLLTKLTRDCQKTIKQRWMS